MYLVIADNMRYEKFDNKKTSDKHRSISLVFNSNVSYISSAKRKNPDKWKTEGFALIN